MRIGFDIDGVLADFIPAYEALFVALTERNDFPPLPLDGPPEWNWPTRYGYTKEETTATWATIKASANFWATLPPTTEFEAFRQWYYQNAGFHELYFVTARPGSCPKRQTECWFEYYLGCRPTVLISDEKGFTCKALHLDLYVDDKLENIQSVEKWSPETLGYLLDRGYNRHGKTIRRLANLTEFLQVVSAHSAVPTGSPSCVPSSQR